jgi:hypothetical protein
MDLRHSSRDGCVGPACPSLFERAVGYYPATRRDPAQIGTKFATGGSLPTLDDKVKAIVVGVVLGMKLIHSRGSYSSRSEAGEHPA